MENENFDEVIEDEVIDDEVIEDEVIDDEVIEDEVIDDDETCEIPPAKSREERRAEARERNRK
jgi:hypothetical protein